MMTAEQEIKNLKKKKKLLRETAEIIRVQEKDVPRVVKRFLDELKEINKNINKK
jgi:alanyl-tRNA synthetase